MLLLHCVFIEVRHRIGCANIFLQFDKPLNDLESLTVCIEKDKMQLGHQSTIYWEMAFDNNFNIVANSLSNLVVDHLNACFRVNIENVHLTEQLIENNNSNNIDVKPLLHEKTKLCYYCINCETLLCLEHFCKRIRAFPCSFLDPSEFFCHHKTNFDEMLLPQIHDLFFGFQYIIVNRILLKDNTLEKDDHLYCKRCLQLVGKTLFEGKAAKLWCESFGVRNSENNNCTIFPEPNSRSNQCRLLMKIVRECSISVLPKTVFNNMLYVKALIQASFSNRQNKYILLNILEQHLTIFKGKPTQNDIKIDAQPYRAMKLFYRHIPSSTSAEVCCEQTLKHIYPLLAYWEKDINVLQIEVSPYLFTNLLNELETNALLLPQMYRLLPDGFLSSYVLYK